MKKIIVIFLLSLLVVTGCSLKKESKKEEKQKNLEGSLSEIMDKLYQKSKIEKDIYMSFSKVEVNKENLSYYLGVEQLDYKEALASEPMISSDAYSVVLVRMNEEADIEKTKKDIKEKVDPRKWICTGVEEENVIVDSYGDVIILIMTDSYAKDLQKSFQSLKN